MTTTLTPAELAEIRKRGVSAGVSRATMTEARWAYRHGAAGHADRAALLRHVDALTAELAERTRERDEARALLRRVLEWSNHYLVDVGRWPAGDSWIDEARAAVGGARTVPSGAERIATELARQITGEGYDIDHDDHHKDGSLAMAAACYAAPTRIFERHVFAAGETFRDPWPWDQRYDKRPHPNDGNVVAPETATRADRIALLTKAGALIAAEIDRLLREEERDEKVMAARAALGDTTGDDS
jgi:hypothetical protein